ncbi:hypothetical protein [Kaistella pullorum]|uniref:Uncharacterized protein n=1 Tax=Kaistella pullorum TaxID=2763074 RepID=A0ABR8WQC8_9FLAO|nr:hypothetical protein [Kaistella pullorum]MBD8019147.1 hypothetical protein [Kaistella pullorum]
MNQIFKIAGIYLGIIFINYFLLIGVLKTTNYSGGEIGMLPIAYLLSSGISFVISLVLILILKFGNQLNYFRAIILYFIVNIGVDIYYGLDPRNGKGFFKNVDILIILTIILTFIIIISAYYYKNKSFKNNGFS